MRPMRPAVLRRCAKRLLCLSIASAYFLAQCAEIDAGRFGAKGDGRTLDTAAIQAAIDAAATSRGTVVFRPGIYVTGALFLKSGVRFRLDRDVVLEGAAGLAAYPEAWTRIAGIEMMWPAAVLNICDQSDVRISGPGVIDGNGKWAWDAYWALRSVYEKKGLRWAADCDSKRPRAIQILRSSRVNIDSLTIRRSGFWTVHICYSDRVSVNSVTIRNNIGGRGPSTDGIDVDSSSNVAIRHCDVDCNDDAICLKAGRDADGLRVNRPTENVLVEDCTVRGGAAGFTIGSETAGGIRSVRVRRVRVLPGVGSGIMLKSRNTRGGTIRDISIRDLMVDGVRAVIHCTLDWNAARGEDRIPEGMSIIPDHWRVMAQPVPIERGLPHFRDVRIARVVARNAREAFAVSGLEAAPFENFKFDEINIQAESAGAIRNTRNWRFRKIRIQTADGSRIAVAEPKTTPRP